MPFGHEGKFYYLCAVLASLKSLGQIVYNKISVRMIVKESNVYVAPVLKSAVVYSDVLCQSNPSVSVGFGNNPLEEENM